MDLNPSYSELKDLRQYRSYCRTRLWVRFWYRARLLANDLESASSFRTDA